MDKLFVISIIISSISAAKILGVFEVPAYSHYQLGTRLFKALAARGHEVTFVSPFEEQEKIKNFRSILIRETRDKHKGLKMDLFKWSEYNALAVGTYSDIVWMPISETTLNSTNVQNLIRSDEKFDIVIIEELFNHAFKGFCYHFNAHCIVASSLYSTRWTSTQIGNPNPPSSTPDPSSRFTNKMSFLETVYNFVLYVVGEIFFHLYVMPIHNEMMQRYFPNVPHLKDIYYNVSLLLLNSHVSTTFPTALQPNVIEIGGFHIAPPKPLPIDLHQYLDNAEDGAIVFSMGSNLNSEDFSTENLEAILTSFSKVKQKILFKWEQESLPGQPSNVKIVKWLPQNDVLAHPNVKVLITHGGLLSCLEAIYHGIPVVGISVFADQHTNSKYAEQEGYGISIPYNELTEEKLSAALDQIINNPSYLQNAQKRSKIMHDEPMMPLDKAIFWIEYVLRHKGAPHLKSASSNLRWYQYLLLDVVAVVVFTVTVPIFTCCWLLKRTRMMTVYEKSKQN